MFITINVIIFHHNCFNLLSNHSLLKNDVTIQSCLSCMNNYKTLFCLFVKLESVNIEIFLITD